MKPHVNTVEQANSVALHGTSSSISPNYASLLSSTTSATSTTNTNSKSANSSNTQPSMSTNGLPPQPYPSNQLTFSGALRPKADPFVNPYMRTSNNGMPGNGLPMNHYSNVDASDRLSAGVYNAHQHSRYKTNSLNSGGSTSSGVVSTGGSSPGHSPVGSMSGQAGTHV